jgi:4-amino-4-deoxy-L-arabinose transferase-like glycosyltransferase
VLGEDEKVCKACGARWPDSQSISVITERAVKRERIHDAKDGQAPPLSTEPVKTPELEVRGMESIIKGTVERFKIADLVSAKVEALYALLDHPNLVALVVLLAILTLKIWFAVGRLYQYWDGYVYLLNARSFAEGNLAPPNYFEVLRPPLYPFMISRVWQSFGESTTLAVLVSPIFTFGAAVLLYLLVKEMFDAKAGLIASVGFLLSPIVMINTDAVFVHGVGVFFVTLAVFSLWRARTKPAFYVLVGAAIGLASLTRYPDLLIALVAVIFMLINLKDSPQNRKRILTWISLGAVIFLGLWLPWLWWCQQVYKDPLISLKLALISGTAGAPGILGPDWLFYIKGLPDFLAVNMPYTISSNIVVPGQPLIILGRAIGTILSGGLLILGLATKDGMKSRRGLLLASWFLVFLPYYSQLANQDLRFMVEWVPPLFAIIGIGVSTFFVFLRTRISFRLLETQIRLRRKLAVSMSAIVGIWLVLLLLGSVAAEIPALSPASYEGPSYGFISVTGFQLSVSWLHQHMNRTEIGVTDMSPFFTYYTGRFFYDWGYVLEVAAARNISTNDALILLHVKYAVFSDYFVKANNINLSFLMKAQEFNGYADITRSRYAWTYTIYQVSG